DAAGIETEIHAGEDDVPRPASHRPQRARTHFTIVCDVLPGHADTHRLAGRAARRLDSHDAVERRALIDAQHTAAPLRFGNLLFLHHGTERQILEGADLLRFHAGGCEFGGKEGADPAVVSDLFAQPIGFEATAIRRRNHLDLFVPVGAAHIAMADRSRRRRPIMTDFASIAERREKGLARSRRARSSASYGTGSNSGNRWSRRGFYRCLHGMK